MTDIKRNDRLALIVTAGLVKNGKVWSYTHDGELLPFPEGSIIVTPEMRCENCRWGYLDGGTIPPVCENGAHKGFYCKYWEPKEAKE